MPNDTAPAWDWLQTGDQVSMTVTLSMPWGHNLWLAETGAGSAIVISQKDIAPPFEVTAHTRAAAAAAAEAMQRDIERACNSHGNTLAQNGLPMSAISVARTCAVIAGTLPLPAEASAALADVVRRAVEREREACADIARRCHARGHEGYAGDYNRGINSGFIYARADIEAAIRARSTDGTP